MSSRRVSISVHPRVKLPAGLAGDLAGPYRGSRNSDRSEETDRGSYQAGGTGDFDHAVYAERNGESDKDTLRTNRLADRYLSAVFSAVLDYY